MVPTFGFNKEIVKGSGFGRIDVLNVLKANEQVRTSAASSK
ncbi:hypothetical protein [Paenibacillus sp. 1011MAR3C5]|nr:hypothetical protein [Paenibacillus sp. 1011MAR3C5]